MKRPSLNPWFTRFATWAATASGSAAAFGAAAAIVLAWVIGGFFVGFDNTLYQLLINTGTTIVTFLMVFVIQNTQNRGDAAMHIKLDELIRADPRARTDLALRHLESCSVEELRCEQHRIEALIAGLSETLEE